VHKTILITGASSGLGAEMARQFAELGYDLALCARRVELLDELKKEIEARHDVRVEVRALDVTEYDRVFEVFRAFRGDFGRLDRVIVNAGVGQGAPLGTGRFDANRRIAETNFVGALAQTEAAAEIFRDQGSGHLVVISSISGLRGMPRGSATYAASKAGVANLAEGLRADVHGSPIKVTVLYPGYIRSELTQRASRTPLIASTEKGVRAIVGAIEKQKSSARVPAWPWAPVGFLVKHMPPGIAHRVL
jgi:short-subunit dehydrogenase